MNTSTSMSERLQPHHPVVCRQHRRPLTLPYEKEEMALTLSEYVPDQAGMSMHDQLEKFCTKTGTASP